MQSIQAPTDSAGSEVVEPLPPRARRGMRATLWTGVGFGLLVLAVAPIAASRLHREPVSSAQAEAEPETRSVHVVRPTVQEAASLTLPANVEGFQSTQLYARVAGYVKQWHVDIGARVKAGDLLAEIDTPELDQELEEAQAKLGQARAELETAKAELVEAQNSLKQALADIARAKANLEYAAGVRARYTALSQEHALSQQELDDSQRNFAAQQAEVESVQAHYHTRQSALSTRAAAIKSREAAIATFSATVRRLEKMQGFKRIVAPFDGIVIRRRAEVGMLVSAGIAQGSQELFAVAQVDRLRIKLNVPQTFASSIEPGRSAKVLAPEHAHHELLAKVARTAGAIDPASRTLAVELELANADRLLLPGQFAQVVLSARSAGPTWTIPVNALLSRPEGTHVAVVTPGNVVRLCKVRLGRNSGRTLEVLAGLSGDELVVVNPPDDLKDDEKVAVP